MSRLRDRRGARRALLVFAAVALLGGGGLALAGTDDRRATAFSLQVPSQESVLALTAGQRACQGPATIPAAFARVELWLGPLAAPGTILRVSVMSASGAQLAAGVLRAPPSSPVVPDSPLGSTPDVGLDRTVSANSAVSFCFQDAGRIAVGMLGAAAQPGSGVLQYRGRSLGQAVSLVALRPRSSSLLSSLPTIFGRASLFRPTWMGAWTFWVLLVAVVAAFPLGALALGLALRSDEDPHDSA